jgi:nitrogen fixation protein FixH
VSDTYYKEELNYEKTIAAKKNSSLLSNDVQFKVQQSAISIVFPFPEVDGIINIYRPSGSSYDKQYALKTKSSSYLLPITDLSAGLWIIKVAWKHNNTMFYNEYRYTRIF